MGAKQSKRSVDISGKEAEGGGAGEVAAAGAGGEGRVEPLADADALKPQLNGDAHIQPEPAEKEKELDSGTPENEKDATTEKESKEDKEENAKEAEAAPVTNGEAEEKIENGESTPAPEDGKKPKKEKVKKKWSLRSISFSRKDKPKQEKKQKDDEAKTNGEPEKVPEETAEAAAAAEPAVEEVAAEAEAAAPEHREPAAETPVTEPLTNGAGDSSPSPAASPVDEAPAKPDPIPEPEQLPVNGLSIEEPKPEVPEQPAEETKPAPPAAEPVDIAPAPEIPAKEVCVQQMPLLESTPPPLPANPPPSSVASFAATTMAPELAAPAGAEPAPPALDALPDTDAITDQIQSSPLTSDDLSDAAKLPSPLNETSEDAPVEPAAHVAELRAPSGHPAGGVPTEVEAVPTVPDTLLEDIPAPIEDEPSQLQEPIEKLDVNADAALVSEDVPETESSPELKIELIPEPEMDTSEIDDAPLPPPPALDDDQLDADLEQEQHDTNGVDGVTDVPELIAEPNIIDQVKAEALTNGVKEDVLEESTITAENAKNKAKAIAITENGVDKGESNGGAGERQLNGDAPSGAAQQPGAEDAAPTPPTPQEPVSVSDKLADLIPEVPDIPEINTETLQETSGDVAVAN